MIGIWNPTNDWNLEPHWWLESGIQVPLTRIPESSTRNPESLAWTDPGCQFWVAVSAEERELKSQSKLRTFCFTFSLVGCFLIVRSETNYSWKSLPVECPCLTMKWTGYELFILDLRLTGNAWQILISNRSFVIILLFQTKTFLCNSITTFMKHYNAFSRCSCWNYCSFWCWDTLQVWWHFSFRSSWLHSPVSSTKS